MFAKKVVTLRKKWAISNQASYGKKAHRLSPVVGEYIYKVINYKWKW